MLRQVWSCRACCQWTDNWSPSQCWSVCFAGPPGTEPKSWIVALKMVVPNLYKWPWIFPHPLQAFSSHKPIWICLKIEDPQFKWVINVSHCLKIKQMAKHMINGSLVGQVTHKHPTSVPQASHRKWLNLGAPHGPQPGLKVRRAATVLFVAVDVLWLAGTDMYTIPSMQHARTT